MYKAQKEEFCVKCDLREFYKKLYSYFNLHENQMILKPLNEDLLSIWVTETPRSVNAGLLTRFELWTSYKNLITLCII